MEPQLLAWIVLLPPLLSAAGIVLVTRRHPSLSAWLSIGAVGLSFLAAVLLRMTYSRAGAAPGEFLLSSVRWLSVGPLEVDLGLRLDPLSTTMLLAVTGVGLMIHIFSRGYMAGDPGCSRFFAGLSLFMFAMLGIVLASNLLLMFVFWELVGVSSYLLIGFWYERPSAADAAKKAFLTNRLGDLGFILGIIIVWSGLGSLDFGELQNTLARDPAALGAMASLAGVLLFMGAVGKSAQFPLHVWLPDAMEGPTPVSALIHAATMVAAGVYMLARAFFLFDLPAAWPEGWERLRHVSALDVIAWTGGISALLAALIALQQSDIKRILAYSTLSQLGYMIMAMGCAAPGAGMFHLVTHAAFKALLFLGAGSIIHALHHQQNIWTMGGLRHRLPVTYWTFLIGTLALCGVPPLSGFYSKDAILAAATARPFLFTLGELVTALTTFYMFRLFFVVWLGSPREAAARDARESPPVMLWPMRVLAGASIIAGFWGVERLLSGVTPGEAHPSEGFLATLFAPFGHAPLAAFLGLFATGVGFAAAYALYGGGTLQLASPIAAGGTRSQAGPVSQDPKGEAGWVVDPLTERLGGVARWMREGFYFDRLYAAIIRVTHDALAALADWIDRWLLAGLLVRGAHGAVDVFGRALRLVQTGNLQTYAFLGAAGLAIVLWLMLA
jgi:NADH-quinone oxidoreductase subunit L